MIWIYALVKRIAAKLPLSEDRYNEVAMWCMVRLVRHERLAHKAMRIGPWQQTQGPRPVVVNRPLTSCNSVTGGSTTTWSISYLGRDQA